MIEEHDKAGPHMTRRAAWQILGAMGGVVPLAGRAFVASTRPDGQPSGHTAGQPSGGEAGPGPGTSAVGPSLPAVIPPIERAGQGGSGPEQVLRLDGTHATLLLIRRTAGLPEIAYWGRRLPDGIAPESVFATRAPDMPNNGPDQWRPLITLLDTMGDWSFDMPGLVASRPGGTAWTSVFTVDRIARTPGGMAIEATDPVSLLGLEIMLTLGPEDVLCSRLRLTNGGTNTLSVARLVSGTFLLPESVQAVRILHGAWAAEFGVSTMSLAQGGIVIESRRNRAHDHFPGMLAGGPATTEENGDAWAVQLGWSGGHRLCAERMEDGRVRLTVGEYLYPGEGDLAPGETLATPPAYVAFSSDGFAGCARAFQAYARHDVVRWPGGSMKPRPVLLNSWEGNFFKLDEGHLRRQIDAAAGLGIERFVLDDGWFGRRRDDSKGLGDWRVAPDIFPHGLRPLSDYVHARGMEFGLWYEPEMVNPDSDLYRAHPDWVLQVRGRPLLTSRNQMVLDIARPEISDYLFEAISDQISMSRIDYIKWDFNRDLVAAADRQGRAAYRRQVLAVYALWDQLHAAHPALEIESCASGGGRADWGALAHTQRVWMSDNTSAVDRLPMQGTAWHFLPPEITGCHISASPNWHDHRQSTLDFRACVALFGHLGVELDPLKLTAEEQAGLKGWIALHKRLRPVLHHGLAQFGESDGARLVRGVMSPDGKTGIFLVAQRDWPSSRLPAPVRLPGLQGARRYRVTVPPPQTLGGHRPSDAQAKLVTDGLVLEGALLRDAGLYLPPLAPQSAYVVECQAV
jgi:alpha-galactosidase